MGGVPNLTTERLRAFWGAVQLSGPDDCWIWKNVPNSQGRPLFKMSGVNFYAHKLSWFISTKRWPSSDVFICHSCDNPLCVNPKHLFEGNARINHDDMAAKGRRASFVGESNSQSKLTELDVKMMRALHFQNGCSKRQIAFRFGVHPVVASKAIRGETWSHVNYLLRKD